MNTELEINGLFLSIGFIHGTVINSLQMPDENLREQMQKVNSLLLKLISPYYDKK